MTVRVYYNLNKQCWSIQQNGLVIKHLSSCLLTNASFKVYESGRQRVIKERRKNVHAYVIGEIAVENPLFLLYKTAKEITYNPYKQGFFYYKGNENLPAKENIPFILCSSERKLFEVEMAADFRAP